MIVIIVDASGNVKYQSSVAIHQGSVDANKVMLVGPFPTAVITVAATLPNGKVYGYDLLKAKDEEKAEYALTSLGNLGGAYLDGSELFAYSYTLKGALTAKAGTLKLQFFINTSHFVEGGTESETFATNNVTVDVINGSGWLPSEPVVDSIYTEIIKEFGALTTAVEGAKSASEDAKESADNAWNHANIAYNIASTVDVRESENFSNLNERLETVETFFKLSEGETLNEALNTLIEIQDYIGEHGDAASALTEQVNTNEQDIAELEDNETWDLVITAEKLEGTNLNNLLATASGRVFVKAVGEFQGTTINVPGTVKFIEFAPSVVFGGGMPTVVSIKGTGNESDCQIIKGASTSSVDPSYMGGCVIEGFKGGVEHCHGEGWIYKNCNNIEHCTFSSFENCKNISKCTSDRDAFNKYFEVAIINCTDIEDLQLADTTPRGYKFSNSKFIKNITFSPGTLGLYASLQFENCAYISNVEIQSYYTDCTFVDAYTCAGFLNDEDIGKTQALTKDGSFEIYKEEDVYISTDETIAYEKSVPKDVCPYAEINSVFGITTTLNGTLVPAKVEKIISKDADSVVIDEVAIPNSVKNDAMWGCGVKNIGRNLTTREYFANTYYFDAKQYVKWVSKTITIDGTKLTATNVQKNSSTGNWCVSVRLGADEFSDYTACALNGFSSSMSRTYGTAYISGFADGTYAMLFINANINTIEAANEWFKNNPVSIQYALKNPIITVVEDTKQSYMLVKGGGSVVCENTNKADAMCSITYLLKGGNT